MFLMNHCFRLVLNFLKNLTFLKNHYFLVLKNHSNHGSAVLNFLNFLMNLMFLKNLNFLKNLMFLMNHLNHYFRWFLKNHYFHSSDMS